MSTRHAWRRAPQNRIVKEQNLSGVPGDALIAAVYFAGPKIRLICAATARHRSCTGRHPTHTRPYRGDYRYAPTGRFCSPLAEHMNSLPINYSRFMSGGVS